MNIPTIDLVLIVTYLVGIVLVGLLVVKKKQTSQEFFLAGRKLKWPVIGAALFASNISTIHLVGLAASGYNEGLVWGNFEWLAILTLILLSLVFAPYYFRTKISTLPEFLEKRYGPWARTLLAFIGIISALFIHIGLSLYAGAAIFEQFFGFNVLTSILVIACLTSLYTIIGGLKSVVVTETIQSVVLLGGAFIVTLFGILALPEHGIETFAEFKTALRPNQLTMLHAESTVGLEWYAVLLGYPILGVWYWCADQTIVQRVLGAEAERDAQIGPLFAGVLKLLPVFFMVFPGVIAYVIFKEQIGQDANQTLPVLITQLIPAGLRGIIVAGLLAALMSTIAAALNSSSTLVSIDIVKRLRPETSDVAQVRVGRISAAVVMLLAIAWSTQGGKFSSIIAGIATIAANLSPPITAVFLFGVFWKRGTKEAAVSTMIIGFILGVLAFLFDFPVFGDQKILTEVWGMGFLMQAWWNFCICCGIFVLISFFTAKPSQQQIDGIIFSAENQLIRKKIKGLNDPRMLSMLLLGSLILLFLVLEIWIN